MRMAHRRLPTDARQGDHQRLRAIGQIIHCRLHAFEIDRAITRSDDALAFRRFLQLADNLAAEQGATRVGLALTEPAPTGSEPWDAAIAALCEYRLKADALPVPDWVTTRTGHPDNPWTPHTSDYDIPADPTRVPPEFLRRGILIEAETLGSA